MERQRTQAQDELNRRRLKDIDAAMIKEAGTETAANPPSPTPTRPSYSPMLAKIADQVDTAAAQYSNGNGSNGNGKAKPEMVLNSQHLMGRLPFNWTLLPPEMQNLPDLLRTKRSLEEPHSGTEESTGSRNRSTDPSAERQPKRRTHTRAVRQQPAGVDADDARPLPGDANRRKRAAQPGSNAGRKPGSKPGRQAKRSQPAEPVSHEQRRSSGSDEPKPGSN